MWLVIALIYFALLAWSAYSVIRDEAYWNGYRKGFKDGIESSNKINQKLFRRDA